MKTIQEVIRELDTEKIENAYFYEHDPKIWELSPDKYDDMTFREYKVRRSTHFQEFLQSLLDIEPKPEEGRNNILFLSKNLDGEDDLSIHLAYSDEILKAESFDYDSFNTYDFSLAPRNEAMSFLVSDNKLTQDNLMKLVVEFLWEISFYGYDEEDVKREAEELDRRFKSFEEHPEKGRPAEEVFEALRVKHGLPKEEIYPEEEAFKDRKTVAVMEYNQYCRAVELKRIRDYLREHDVGRN